MTLTFAEKLFIWRHRAGMTQHQAARYLNMTGSRYTTLERGAAEEMPTKLRNRTFDHLTPEETCVLERRRRGMTQEQVAEELGLSRVWVVRMERGLANSDKLVDYWL